MNEFINALKQGDLEACQDIPSAGFIGAVLTLQLIQMIS